MIWRHVSPHGRKFIAAWEGCVLHPYRDIVGKLTIGVGHLVVPGEHFPDRITAEEADALFARDLVRFEDALNLTGIDLGQNEFDALTSWLFNCGTGALPSSTVLRCLRTGDRAGVPAALEMWCRAGGVVNKGLLNRRRSEGQLFRTPDAAEVHALSDEDRARALALVDTTIADWQRGEPVLSREDA